MNHPEFDAEDLSLLLDGELAAPAAEKLHTHIQEHVGTWVQYHNMSALSAACQNLPDPVADSNEDDFLSSLLGRIDALPIPETAAPTFSELSAYYDHEHNPYEEALSIPSELEPVLAHLQTLSTALQSLPVYQPSPDFLDRVMAAIDTHTSTFETLSAYYDGELSEAETLQVSANSQGAANTHLHNMRVVTGELQALPAYQPSAGFLDNLLQAIDSTPSFVELSAHYDGEHPELEVSGAEAQTHLHNMKVVTGELQALPAYQPSAGFLDNLLQAIDSTPNFAELSAHYDGEHPELEVSGAEAQTHLHNMKVVTGELQALPAYQPSAGFLDNLLQAIDSTPSFVELSAHYDGEHPELVASSAEAQTHLHNMKVVTGELQALPAYQPSPDFLERLTRELDIQSPSPNVFALPQVAWFKQYGRMVAGVAMFGLLALAGNYFMNTQGTTTANIPTEYIVELENQSEDAIFSEDLVESIEIVSDDGYHQLIGG